MACPDSHLVRVRNNQSLILSPFITPIPLANTRHQIKITISEAEELPPADGRIVFKQPIKKRSFDENDTQKSMDVKVKKKKTEKKKEKQLLSFDEEEEEL